MRKFYIKIEGKDKKEILKIDLFVVIISLLILSFLPLFYYAYKFFVVKPEPVIKEFVFPLRANNLPDSIIAKVKVGDVEVVNNDTIAKIVSIDTVFNASKKIPSIDGTYITEIDSNLKQMYIKLKIKAQVIRDILIVKEQYYYRNFDLNKNKKFIFKSNKNKYKLELEFAKRPKIAKIAKIALPVVAYNVPSSIVAKIKIGDYEQDSLGNKIAVIKKVRKINRSYYYKKMLGEDDSVLIINKNRKKIWLNILLIGTEKDIVAKIEGFNKQFFNTGDLKLLYGKTIELNFVNNESVVFKIAPFEEEKYYDLTIKLLVPFQYGFIVNQIYKNMVLYKEMKYIIRDVKKSQEGIKNIEITRLLSIDSVANIPVQEYWRNYSTGKTNMKRLWLTIKLLTREYKGNLYFYDDYNYRNPIFIGSNFRMILGTKKKVSIDGIIIDIINKKPVELYDLIK